MCIQYVFISVRFYHTLEGNDLIPAAENLMIINLKVIYFVREHTFIATLV